MTVVTETPAESLEQEGDPVTVVRQPSLRELLTLVRAHDVLHVAGPAITPILMGLLSGKPVVVEHHGFQTVCPNGQMFFEPTCTACPGHFIGRNHGKCIECNAEKGLLNSFKSWLLTFVRRALCKRVAANISPTKWLGDLIALPRLVTIHHGVRAAGTFTRQHSAASPLVAFQGRLVSTKGVRILLEATKMMLPERPTLRVVIIGDGPEKSSLEALSHQWKLDKNVRFTGQLPSSQINEEFAEATAVVVPSISGEVFGLVVLENMLRGVPVVVSSLGAFTEVIGDCGIAFATGNAADLAEALSRLLTDFELASHLGGKASRRAATVFALSTMIDSHAELYRSVFDAQNR